MGWFERQLRGRDPAEVTEEHQATVEASGLGAALSALAGPFGVRRFVVRFTARGQGLRISGLDAEQLRWGGGPPPPDETGQHMAGVEAALRKLKEGLRFRAGAVGFVRDARGHASVIPRFDEDAEGDVLGSLPVPAPPGHPLEHPSTAQLLAGYRPRMEALQRRTQAVVPDWEEWEIMANREMSLTFGAATTADGQVTHKSVRRHRCQVLGTWEPGELMWQWEVESPLFSESVFDLGAFACGLNSAVELALMCAARLEADWLFMEELEPGGTRLFAAVND
jgi:hypothetical protein